MNLENEVKVRWTIPGRHVQLTMLLYNIYSWPSTYSVRKIDQTQRLNTVQWTMKMRPRSDDIYPLDMYTLQSYHTTNIVDLLHIVWEKQTKTQKFNTSGGQAVLGRQQWAPTPWLTKRHGYDPTTYANKKLI